MSLRGSSWCALQVQASPVEGWARVSSSPQQHVTLHSHSLTTTLCQPSRPCWRSPSDLQAKSVLQSLWQPSPPLSGPALPCLHWLLLTLRLSISYSVNWRLALTFLRTYLDIAAPTISLSPSSAPASRSPIGQYQSLLHPLLVGLLSDPANLYSGSAASYST